MYLALAGFATATSGGLADIDLSTLRPMAWFMTPHGPQSVAEPSTIAEFRRRDYLEITAQQAADFFAGAAEIPDVSFITGQELPAAMASLVTSPTGTVAETLRAASVAAAAEDIDDSTTSLGAAALAAFGTAKEARLTNSGVARSVSLDLTWASAPAGPQVTVPTGIDANNDIVELAVLYDATAPFLGYEYVLCASPYPASNVIYENPCLWVSHDGNNWVPLVNGVPTPGGVVTPVVPTAVQGDGTNSDPLIYRGPDGTYYVLWNQFLNTTGAGGTGTGGKNWSIKAVSAPSLAGPWSTPVTIVSTASPASRPSSPSIFWDGRTWHMYCVDIMSSTNTAITHYTNSSPDPLAGAWTKLTNPTITMPAAYSSQVWWHLNAYRWGSTHVLLVQDSQSGTSAGGNHWLLYSNDGGATWTVPQRPVLASTVTYRGALVVADRPGVGTVLDLFYGRLGATWEMRRTTVGFTPPPTDPDALANGESTIPRRVVAFGTSTASVGVATGSMRGTVFTAQKTETVNNVRIWTGTTAAAATPTLCRVGVYSISSSGVYTLVGATANDTTLFATAITSYTRAITTPFTKVAGQRYAVCVLVVSGAATPTFIGVPGNSEMSVAPALVVRHEGQSDLPASFTPTGGLAASLFYAVLTP